MKPFGKTEEELNENEKALFHMMLSLATQMMLVQDMFGPLVGLLGRDHNKEIVSVSIYTGVKVLNLPEPKSQEDFNELQTKTEESDYSLMKFLDLYKEEYESFENTLDEKDKEQSAQKFAIVIFDKLGIEHEGLDKIAEELAASKPEKETTEGPKG